jgi:hypothetical protein
MSGVDILKVSVNFAVFVISVGALAVSRRNWSRQKIGAIATLAILPLAWALIYAGTYLWKAGSQPVGSKPLDRLKITNGRSYPNENPNRNPDTVVPPGAFPITIPRGVQTNESKKNTPASSLSELRELEALGLIRILS